jgi:transposase-like protein
MSATLEPVTRKKPEPSAEQVAAEELVRLAREQGLSLTGPGGLLKQLTKVVIETALDQEMTEHLGHERNTPSGNEAGNVRNGSRPKTVLTEATGQVGIEVPRDRDGTFEPQIVKKRQRRLNGVDEIVLSLYAKGLTTGEISAHFAEIYGASVSKETVSRITDKVVEEMQGWAARPLDEVYAAVFIDAIVVKVRDGQVANRPVYAAIGVTLAGEKDVLGLWAGTGGEGAKFWMSVLTDLRNRGVRDVFFVVCDGLKGLPDVVSNVWPQAIVQTCIVHLIRNTFRLTSKRDWDAMKRDVKLIYTAVNASAARAALDDLTEKWGKQYGAVIRLWESAWEKFTPFLDYDLEIRTVICSTNAIESLNARYRRAVKARGHFPTEQAAIKCLYLATRSLYPTGTGRTRWTMRWKPALNAFAITFADRSPSSRGCLLGVLAAAAAYRRGRALPPAYAVAGIRRGRRTRHPACRCPGGCSGQFAPARSRRSARRTPLRPGC